MKTKLIAIVSIALALAMATLGGPAFAQDNKSENIRSRILCQDGAVMQDSSNVYFVCQIYRVCPNSSGQLPDSVVTTGGLPADNEGIFVVFMPADLTVENTVRQFCLTEDPGYASQR